MASLTITVPDAIVPKVIEALRANMGSDANGLTDTAVARAFISEAVKRVYKRYWTAKNAQSVQTTANTLIDAARADVEAANATLKTDLAAVTSAVETELTGVV